MSVLHRKRQGEPIMQSNLFTSSPSVRSSRILYTPSPFARSSLLHLQEVGSLTAIRPHTSKRHTQGSDRASSQGCTIRQVEILSNKLLTTAFEASLGCIVVMRCAKRRQQGCRDSYRAPKSQQTRVSTLWSERKTTCGFIVTVRFHTALRRRKDLFM